MGLGLNAIVPLGFVSFLRGLVRLRAPLKLLAWSRKLWGVLGGPRGQKRLEFMGLGLKANSLLVFLSFLRVLVRLRSPSELLADSKNLWGFGGCPEVKKRVEFMRLGLKATVPLGFFVLFEGFGQAERPIGTARGLPEFVPV